MATEEEFQIGRDGSVAVTSVVQLASAPGPSSAPKEPLSGIELIAQMVADPDVAIADISRLIAGEIVNVMKKMTTSDPLDRGAVSQRDLNDQVKAYRELQKTLTEAETLSKKDILNLDGPKFKFVFTEIIGLFKKALKDAAAGDQLTQNVMLQFGDLIKSHDEILRRELSKIESGR